MTTLMKTNECDRKLARVIFSEGYILHGRKERLDDMLTSMTLTIGVGNMGTYIVKVRILNASASLYAEWPYNNLMSYLASKVESELEHHSDHESMVRSIEKVSRIIEE